MKKHISFVLSVFLIVSCRSADLVSPNHVATKTLVSVTELPISETAIPSTPTVALLTPTNTLTPDLIPTKTISQKCPVISEKANSLSELAQNGTVVVYDKTRASSYLLDLQSGTQYPLPFQDQEQSVLPQISVSPTGDYMAYIEDIKNNSGQILKQKVYVVDNQGNVLALSQINPEILFADWHWLDNERIEFSFQSLTPKDGTVPIFYPFKNEWKYLSNKLPNFYKYFDLDPSQWLVEYSPDLEEVVYLGQIEEFVVGPIVSDVKSNEVIWKSPVINAEIKIPRWSPSGEKVAVITGKQLYLISKDRQISVSPNLPEDSEIMDMAWSPSGDYIAALVRNDSSSAKGSLLLYDVHGNRFIDYCVESNNVTAVRLPLWSDNSQFVYFRLNNTNLEETPIIIDVNSNKVYTVTDALDPIAWMNSER